MFEEQKPDEVDFRNLEGVWVKYDKSPNHEFRPFRGNQVKLDMGGFLIFGDAAWP